MSFDNTSTTHHEVPLRKRHLIRKPFPRSMASSPFNLIRIVVQTHNIAACKSRKLACRFANTAPNVKNRHRIVDINPMCKVVFMPGKSLQQRFARCKAAKMEGLRPAFFVQVGDEVVVAVRG